MKIKSLLGLVLGTMLVMSTAFAATVQRGAYLDFNRNSGTGYSLANNVQTPLPQGYVLPASKNLLVKLDGYNFYMDVPSWIAAEHTGDEVKSNGRVDAFNYNIKAKDEGIQVMIIKGIFNQEVKNQVAQAIKAALQPVGTKLPNGEVVTKEMQARMVAESLDISLLNANVTSTAQFIGDDLKAVVVNPIHFENGYALLTNTQVGDNPQHQGLTSAFTISFVNGDDLILMVINYNNKITAAQRNDIIRSILTANYKKAE